MCYVLLYIYTIYSIYMVLLFTQLIRSTYISLLLNYNILTLGLGRGFQIELIKTLQQTFFSIIIDETTDVKVKSQMAVVVQFWSRTKHELIVQIIDFVVINDASANGLTLAVFKLLDILKIPLKK